MHLRSAIPVATVVGMVAEGMNQNEILGRWYPDLDEEDIPEGLRFAPESAREKTHTNKNVGC